MRYAIFILLLAQSSCVTFLAGNMGAGAAVVTVAETVDTAKTAGDVVAYGTTGKTLTDHALDAVTGLDCKLFNVFDRDHKICRERMPDLSTKEKIQAFQRSKGIEPTGTIGPKTRMAVWRIQHELD
jgi:murein L,D-transpeptidase YcbB/YkuD